MLKIILKRCYEAKSSTKTPQNSVCVGHLLCGMKPALNCGIYTQLDFLRRKLIFLLQTLVDWK